MAAVATVEREAAAGRLSLRFARSGGRTVLAKVRSHQPLQIGRVLDRPGGWVDVYLLNPSGGLLGGDDLATDVTLEAGAHVRLLTIGATKVYRSVGTPTRQRLDLRVAADAALVYLPDPLIPFAGAWLEQATRVEVDPGGAAWLGEVVGPGRVARGERFAYRCLSFDLEVHSAGRRLVIDRARLEPDRWAGGPTGRLGPHTHFARLFLLGRAAPCHPDDRAAPPPTSGDLGRNEVATTLATVVSARSALPNRAGTLITALGSDAFSLQSHLAAIVAEGVGSRQ